MSNDNDLLANSQLFRGADLNALTRFLQSCPRRELAAGTILLAAADDSDTLYVVLSGELQVERESEGGSTALGAGECVGETAFASAQKSGCRISAQSDAQVLEISAPTLREIVSASHEVARNLFDLLAKNRARAASQGQLEFQRVGSVDMVTGLHNSAWLHKAFTRQMQRCTRDGKGLTLVMVDIDHLQTLNERHGREGGDRVLANVAQTLSHHLRPGDLLARFGDEDFLLLLPGTDIGHAVPVAERLRHAVSRAKVAGDDAEPVTISLGLAQMTSEDTLGSLIAMVDAALHRAKSQGRNRVAT